MKKRLTKRTVDTTRPTGRRTFLWDTEVTGFGLKVTAKGRKVYVFQYRIPGAGRGTTARRLTLGRHGELTPDQARKLAAEHLVAVKAGDDPAARRGAVEQPTVRELARRFMKEYLPNKKRPPRASTISYYEGIFRCHILPQLGDKQVAAVTPADIERRHSAMRATPYIANRTLSVLQQTFDQAERWGWRAQHTNPARHIDRYAEARRGARKEVMLSPEQMRRLLAAIDREAETHDTSVACEAIRLAFWTGWRIGEVLRLQWQHVDLDTGQARLIGTKTASEEYRQLPAEAITILRRVLPVAGCPYVFPGRDLVGHLSTVKRPWERIRKRAGLANLEGLGPLRLHDLRHNVVSWDVSRGVALEIAGRNVGHRSRRATEVYAHFAPDALKRAADERAAAMRRAVEESEKSQEA